MRLRILISLTTIFLLAGAPDCVFAQNAKRSQHAWGRCNVGAWKEVQQTMETLDEKGNVVSSSTTETRTTLEEVTDKYYTLRIEMTVHVGGKRIVKPPQVTRQGYNGESIGQFVSTKSLGEGDVTIAGDTFASKIQEVVVNGGDTKRISTVHYSDKLAPFVLQRVTRTTDSLGKVTNSTTQVRVMALDVPYPVLEEVKKSALVEVIQKQPKSTSKTLEYHCDAVPGGVVANATREDDESGHTIRLSWLDLLDYGAGEDDVKPGRRGFFRNRRNRSSSLP